MMSGADGYEVLSTLRQNLDTVLVPFIFLTAKSTHEDIRQGMNLGADDYLTKPFSVHELLAAIAIAARLAKQEAASQAQQNSALWDSLTHLPNKRYLIEQLNRFIQQTPINTTSQYALLFVGLDSFKEINDAFGQQRSLAANSYSCLSRLHQFPTDTLKVERSFISQIEADGQNAVIWSFLVTEPVPIHLPGINCVYGFLLLLTF